MKKLVKKYFFYDVQESKLGLFCEAYKNLYGLNILIYHISTLLFLIITLVGFYNSVIAKENIPLANTIMILGIIPFCIQILECKSKKHPSTNITQFLYRIVVSFLISGKCLTAKDWIKIEEKDKRFYNLLLNSHIPFSSFNLSLRIARIIPDCKLVCAYAIDPENPGDGYHPIAYVLKNDYVYDPILHKNISRKDYEKLFSIKIHSIWRDEVLSPEFELRYLSGFKK